LIVRAATAADAAGMQGVLAPILASWQSPRDSSTAHIVQHYIAHPDNLVCSVAETDRIVGFQALKLLKEGNPYDVPAGWGFIGTYVALDQGGRGIGRALFAASCEAARRNGVKFIDATIGADNAVGLGYYEAMGFRTYKRSDGAVRKRFDLE